MDQYNSSRHGRHVIFLTPYFLDKNVLLELFNSEVSKQKKVGDMTSSVTAFNYLALKTTQRNRELRYRVSAGDYFERPHLCVLLLIHTQMQPAGK